MQTLLLALGVALVVIAVFAFAWFAYGLLGDVGRAACVSAVGAIAVGVAVALTPRLRVTAEGLAWAGLIALAIGAILVSTINEPHIAGKPASFICGAMLFVVAAAGLGLRRIPLPGGMPPLRAYSLYAVFAMPFAVLMMAYALPIDDDPQRIVVQCALAGVTATLLAVTLPADARRTIPDFEAIAALVVATVILAFGSIEFAMATDYGHLLWGSAALLPVMVAAWLGVLAVTYVRPSVRDGRPLPTGLRFVPVSAIIWVLAVSTTLVLRMFPLTMPSETRRMWAYLPAILVASAAAIAACVMPGPREEDTSELEAGTLEAGASAGAEAAGAGLPAAGKDVNGTDAAGKDATGKGATAEKAGGRPVVSLAERVAAALNGAIVLLIMVCGEFGRDGIPALVTAMAAFVGLLAATGCAWMRAARPARRLERARREIVTGGLEMIGARPVGPAPTAGPAVAGPAVGAMTGVPVAAPPTAGPAAGAVTGIPAPGPTAGAVTAPPVAAPPVPGVPGAGVPASRYPVYPANPYPTNHYPTAAYLAAVHSAGPYPVQPYPVQPHPVGPYQAASYPAGSYPTEPYPTGPYPAEPYPAESGFASANHPGYGRPAAPAQPMASPQPAPSPSSTAPVAPMPVQAPVPMPNTPPMPAPQPQMPAPRTPVIPPQPPQPQQPVIVTKARGVDVAGAIVTAFAALATVFLFLNTLIAPRPYAPADLICGAVGVGALAVGIRWLMMWPRVHSWTALWPALTLLTVPSLLVSWTSPLSFPRALILFGIALGMLLWGALRGLQAPLIYGTAVLVVHMITVLWPWLAVFSRQFWWVWLLIGGVVLIVAAARYEASLRTMRTLAVRINQLR